MHVQWTRRVKVEKGLIWFDGKSMEIHTKTFRTYAHLIRKFLLVDALPKITTVNYHAFTSINMATMHKVIISFYEKIRVWKRSLKNNGYVTYCNITPNEAWPMIWLLFPKIISNWDKYLQMFLQFPICKIISIKFYNILFYGLFKCL